MTGSGLYYYGTRTEVRLGDRVRMRRFLRSDVVGVVCYLPRISPPHPEMEYDDIRQWAIRGDDAGVYPILYDPDGFQPPKKIEFIGRGDTGTLTGDERLE